MEFLLWGWNWTSKAIGRCADDDGDLTFDSESVRVTRDEERAYVALFKHPCSGKNGYRTVWYHDRLRRNVAMALMQILRPSRPTYMMTWHVGFVERALRGDRIHWARIFKTTTRQHIGLIPEGYACYLSSFFINFYRGMGILTLVENRDFPPREVPQEGEEVVLANEVNSDLEVKPRNSLKQRRKRSRGRQDSQPRKRRSIDEAAVVEKRLRRAAPIEMRSPDFWSRSKMKVMRLILEEYSSTESRRAATRGCSVQEAGPVAITDTEKEEDPMALEEVAAKVVEDVEPTECGSQKYLDRKRDKYAYASTNGSYVEIVHNRTRTKRLEACRTAYDVESLRVDELSAAAEKKEQECQTELAARAKKSAEYEAVRISDLELIEKLEAQCSELRTQRLQAEEQLCEVETRLTEAEEKNRQLSEETRDALTARVNRCLRGYVLWQIESHNGLRLRKIEHRVAELIARSR
ncbi:hypothetical protein AXG93_2958s1010 [Marchantia polymorpha subsp. ruderalis]|uniref:Uncharacterized protein n=1 Tax=Marchantia polymorpha subsp. ruderalis TaxID=1480154 RepID=A0A176VGL2_MARPO|nr:hypothetical protein AXG93_2958s1010 [Marchantia polymorpha subsp. ruderalis]